MTRKLTVEQFISKAREVHGDRYDYSRVDYQGNKTKVIIGCKEHGDFTQAPSHHNQGKGCTYCADKKHAASRLSCTEDFVEKARNVHGDKYDYSRSEYTTAITKLEIICEKHGVFLQTPNSHLCGSGCEACAKEKIKRPRLTQQEFINAAKSKHGDKYDYSLSVYVIRDTPVTIICPTHGEFSQSATAHMVGKGCSSCMKTGYQTSKPGSFYVMQNESTTKVGITNRDVKVRLRDIVGSSGKPFTLVFFIRFEDGKIPHHIEKQILPEMKQKYAQELGKHDGYTECFVDVDIEKLLLRVTQLCSEAFIAKTN